MKVDGTTVKIWPMGEWFTPCFGMDHMCIQYLEEERVRATWDNSNLFGRHHFLETAPKAHIDRELEDFYVQ